MRCPFECLCIRTSQMLLLTNTQTIWNECGYMSILFEGDDIAVQKDFKSPFGSIPHDTGALFRISMPPGSFEFAHLILVIKVEYATVELHLDIGAIDTPVCINEPFREFFGHFYGSAERLNIGIGYDFTVRHLLKRTAAKVIEHHHAAYYPAAGTQQLTRRPPGVGTGGFNQNNRKIQHPV